MFVLLLVAAVWGVVAHLLLWQRVCRSLCFREGSRRFLCVAIGCGRCAGLCCYEGAGGLCTIKLSEPLLKFRPRSDLVNTLLVRLSLAMAWNRIPTAAQ